jgi:hypothetical protein
MPHFNLKKTTLRPRGVGTCLAQRPKETENNPKRYLRLIVVVVVMVMQCVRFLRGNAEILYMRHIKFVLQGPKADITNATQKEKNKHAARTRI